MNDVKYQYFIVQGRREEDGKIFFYNIKNISDSEKDASHFTDKKKATTAKTILQTKAHLIDWKIVKVTQITNYEII